MREKSLTVRYDALAPDGSEIRTLLQLPGGSVVHCTLPAGQTTQAVRHRSVAEIWYILSGAGRLWRRDGERELITLLTPGVAVDIPMGISFQFKAVGIAPLCFLICTMPPWPGDDEAVTVEGHWDLY